jgi:S1-C subfamily serine protease
LTEQEIKKRNLKVAVILGVLLPAFFVLGLWTGRNALKSPPAASSELTKQPANAEMQEELKKSVGVPEVNGQVSKRHAEAEHPLGENRIADIAAQAASSVVNVETTLRNNQRETKQPFNFNPFGSRNPSGAPGSIYPHRSQTLASGSGLIVRSNGYVITNNHLVRPGNEMKVTLSDQRTFTAKLIGRDLFTDLAVLKIEANNLPVMPFGDSKLVRPGEWAIAIGNPLGFDHTVTLGIVSAINRSLADLNSHVDLIQTDAAINPGNSGGPLLNIDGEVIGINSAIRSDAQNIGFAIPVDVVQEVANSLIKTGAIVRPYLGVFMKDLDDRVITGLNLPKDSSGVLILRVVAGSPAERAGMISGDFIEKVNGQEVTTVKEVRRLVKTHVPGDTLLFTIKRNGKLDDRKLMVGNYPNEE